MSANDNKTLEDVMDGASTRRSAPVTIDITKGKVTEAVENDQTKLNKQMHAQIVNSARPDLSSIKPVDINEILPPRQVDEVPTEVDDLFSELDAAVDREKASITQRVDAITEAQDRELMEQYQAKQEEELQRQDKEIMGDVTPDADYSDDVNYGDDDDDDIDISDVIATNPNNVSTRPGIKSAPKETAIRNTPPKAAKTTKKTQAKVDKDTTDEEVVLKPSEDEGLSVSDTSFTPEYQDTTESYQNQYENQSEFASYSSDDADDEVSATSEVVADEPKEDIAEAAPVEAPSDTKEDKEYPILSGFSDDELFDDSDDEPAPVVDAFDDDERTEKIREDYKKDINDKVLNGPKIKINLGKFTIAQKGINAQKVMKAIVKNNQNVADWVLYSAGRPISVSGLSGPEILKLNPENSTRNRLNTFRDIYNIIYTHVIDGNKPEYETWLKQTRFVDLQHIYFALYKATFKDSNFLTYTCSNPQCRKVFIKDIPFEDLVVYADDETKEKVKEILSRDTTTPTNADEYPVDLVQISANYVFGLRSPSIWNVIIETASLSEQFINRHADLIDLIAFIDCIYLIDYKNNQLIPVDTKPDPNNQSVTSARRAKAFYDIINTLSTEEYYDLRKSVEKYEDVGSKIMYKVPDCDCPDCGAHITGQDFGVANEDGYIDPSALLFMRHQLALIGTM